MFALLNPAALLALLGLLVPVAIHLWNRRPGREVAVGSLRWLAAGANRRLRNLKPEQLGLLLLRAALLAVLAVAVAGPVWRTARPTSRGVVLLSAEAARLPALAGMKPAIDSLRRRGYALRWLAAGFAPVPARTWQQLSAGQAGAASDSVAALAAAELRGPAFAWARVQQAAAAFPGQPLVVVTGAALRNFGGSHAPLPVGTVWQALPDTTTTAWLAAAAQVGDSLRLLVGRSDETRTTYQRKKVRQPQPGQPMRVPGLPPMQLRPTTEGGTGFVLTNAPAESGTRVELAPMNIAIYASPNYATDARYLEAALRAAGSALAVAPRFSRLSARPAHLKADWTFWLSAEALPTDWREDTKKYARHVWLEAAGPGVVDTARFAATEPSPATVTVFRRNSRLPLPEYTTVWADGRGQAILSRQQLGQGSIYQLHTRLAPAWSELADDPQLPARLLALLQPEPTAAFSGSPTPLANAETAHERRALAPAQLPATSAGFARPATARITPPTFRSTNLRPWLVLLAGLLLLLERLLARRRDTLTPSPTS